MDTVTQELRLPDEKLSSLKAEVRRWQRRRSCTKRELQALLGLLNHAASVVGPGRTFMRGLIDSLKGVKRQHHHIAIKAQARDDLWWWGAFCEGWNGISMVPSLGEVSHTFYSDASGSWGCGAAWGSLWFQQRWPELWLDVNIAVKELVPVVLAAAIWGATWSGGRVRVRCDNEAVVYAITKGRARDPAIMRLVRCLFLLTACHNFVLVASHIPGRDNHLADAISRNEPIPPSFQMAPQPCLIPPGLEVAVMDQSTEWTSEHWRRVSHFISVKA